MTKPFDVSKFREEITKSIDGLSIGFNDPTDWISTGNYTLNYLISGDFHKGVPMGKVTVFAGESGAGKSYICSGNLVRNAQEQGIYVVLIDSENALDEAWLHALGVDTDESKLLKLNMAMIDDVAKTISEFMKMLRAEYREYMDSIHHEDDAMGLWDFYSENSREYERTYGITQNRDTDELEYTWDNKNYSEEDEDDYDY